MANTEGSRVISQTVVVRKTIKYFITSRQMEILTGSLLGDAYIHPLGKICFEQTESQLAYLKWMYSEFNSLAYPKIAKVTRLDKRSGKITTSYRFFLRQIFQSWRQAWYPDNIKSIPDNLEEWFTPLSLAVWYMDDGHLNNGRAPLFASENFTKDEASRRSNLLSKNWNLISYINQNNRIRLSQRSTQDFVRLVEPHIVPSMRYKITLTP